MLKALVKNALPGPVKDLIVKFRNRSALQSIASSSEANRKRTAQEIFTEIYRKNLWGGKPGELCSGIGSYGEAADTYIKNINGFIAANNVHSVLDLGCGDFNIGSRIVCEDYTGVDVVKDVVDRNNSMYGNDRRRFVCIDITGPGELPVADLCLMRQVAQHLSNEQVKQVLTKLAGFKFVIVTEHHPSDRDFTEVNLDKVHGGDTRLFRGSGVYLDKPPFNAEATLLFEHPGSENVLDVHARGPIRSFLVKIAPQT